MYMFIFTNKSSSVKGLRNDLTNLFLCLSLSDINYVYDL